MGVKLTKDSIDLGIVGSFSFAMPANAVISSAVFSGVNGTALPVYTTAACNVDIVGETIVVCAPGDFDCTEFDGAFFRPFGLALGASTYAGPLDGLADPRAIRTEEWFVRMGSPTLTIEYQVVAEPASTALAGLALPLAGAAGRRQAAGGSAASL